LAGEKRALAFFKTIVETTTDSDVRRMADEFVEEEAEHVNLVYRMLTKYPKPVTTWSADPDPPAAQE
jgi:rubrerythrin